MYVRFKVLAKADEGGGVGWWRRWRGDSYVLNMNRVWSYVYVASNH